MKLFAVIPLKQNPEQQSAIFSSVEKALDFIKRNQCHQKVHLFEAYVKGDYQYPNEVFLVRKYPPGFISDVIAVELFARYPLSLINSDSYYSNVENLIPDSQKACFRLNNYVVTQEDIKQGIVETFQEILEVRISIIECNDTSGLRKLHQKLNELQHKQLWQMETLERL
ncbi:MAG: hypothetical protein ABRQ23_00110 [Syntrophomonadaceae bacterium]